MTTQKSFAKGAEFPPLAEGTLRIYSMRFCPFAQRTRLVLAHKQIPHETVNVNTRPAHSKPDWFLQRNPLGLVPVLEKDGKVVYESTVCNEYLDTMYPEKPLMPSDPYLKARDRMLQERFGKVISSFFKYSTDGSDEAFQVLSTALQPFEEEIGKRGHFFGGKEVGMLDYNMWPFFERMRNMKLKYNREVPNVDRLPNLRAWTERMMGLPSVKECYFPPEVHLDFLKTYNDERPNYDIGLEE